MARAVRRVRVSTDPEPAEPTTSEPTQMTTKCQVGKLPLAWPASRSRRYGVRPRRISARRVGWDAGKVRAWREQSGRQQTLPPTGDDVFFATARHANARVLWREFSGAKSPRPP